MSTEEPDRGSESKYTKGSAVIPEMKKVDPIPPPTFTEAQFHAHVGTVRFDTSGKLHVELVVEAEDRPEGVKLVDTYGTMLRFDVCRKRPKKG